MIVIRVAVTAKASQRDSLIDHLRADATHARTLPGCIRFALLQDAFDENGVFIYEEWSDRESFDAYRGSAFFEELGMEIMPLLAAAPDSAYYDASTLA
jgi:quinol monooxygenase YgiN